MLENLPLLILLSEKKRNIVTEKAGTTRDSINTKFKGFGFEFEIIDTAGIRKN